MDQTNTSFSSTNPLQKYPPFDSSQVEDKFKCPECSNVILNAHQTDDCGCQYCSECLTNILATTRQCKKCGTQLTSDIKLPDRHLQNKINRIEVQCSFIDCSWQGGLKDYIQHHKSHNEIENKCLNCLKVFSNKTHLEAHMDPKKGDCPKQIIDCEYKKVGCPEPGPYLREQYNDHLTTYNQIHLRLLYEHFDKEIQRLNNLEVNYKLSRIDSNLIKADPELFDSGYKSFNPNEKVTQLVNKVDMLQNTQNGLISDISKIVKSNDKLKQENLLLRQNLSEYKTLAQDLHKTLSLTQVSLLTLEERLINQEKVSFDGTLLWKITNVHERMQEAKSGRQISFYSPPFYSNRNGYKMCARIYLNGDGNGRNTHLSLFFVILRGENDALLRWPFRQKVTFILIDQSISESRENVIDAFRPDPNSSSFRRPTSDMNIASGLPVFCPLGKLMSSDHEYIKDNTMFIKIMVDVKDLNDV